MTNTTIVSTETYKKHTIETAWVIKDGSPYGYVWIVDGDRAHAFSSHKDAKAFVNGFGPRWGFVSIQ